MIETVKKLCVIPGVSGDEEKVRSFVRESVKE